MKKDSLLYIEDINNAIDWIISNYVLDITYEEFSYDQKTQDAVIRQIAIIGEALNKLDTNFLSRYPQLPAREAVSMRNVLVHDYDNVDVEKLWKTIKVDLPVLKEIVSSILLKENVRKARAIKGKNKTSLSEFIALDRYKH